MSSRSISVAQSLRPRRSRVKTGCICCRIRRKKCDERRPICSGCHRNKLICSWTSTQSAHGRSSDSGWRTRLESGEGVGQVGEGLICMPAGASRYKDAIKTDGGSLAPMEVPAPCTEVACQQQITRISPGMNFPLSHCLFQSEICGTASPKSFTSRILFEHYTNETAHRLSTVHGNDNPFITYVLPIAHSDSIVMDVVLAVSGAHISSSTSDLELKSASFEHYGIVLRQIKHILTQVNYGKVWRPEHLLLTALMLCHFEVSKQFHRNTWACKKS